MALQGEYRYRKLELDYFSKIELQPVSVIDYIAKAKGGITSMQFSPNGHYLALSLVNGFIVVLNVIFEPPEYFHIHFSAKITFYKN